MYKRYDVTEMKINGLDNNTCTTVLAAGSIARYTQVTQKVTMVQNSKVMPWWHKAMLVGRTAFVFFLKFFTQKTALSTQFMNKFFWHTKCTEKQPPQILDQSLG